VRAACSLDINVQTLRQLRRLQDREITALDYDALMALPSHPTKTLTEEALAALGTNSFECTEQHPQFEECCAVCQEAMEVGDILVEVPCQARHTFHHECIDQWLRRSSACCPIDSEALVISP